jgi:hypothetical protein
MSTGESFRAAGGWIARIAAPAILLLAAAPPAGAAGILRGEVTDSETGESLGFASVVAERDGERTGVIADDQGSFRLALEPGRWVLRISFVGYETFEDSLLVIDLRERALSVELVPDAIPMEKVEVRGDRLDEERDQPSVVSLDAETLRALPAFGEVDPIRTLQYLPGVQTASDISSGLYVRGGGPDQTLILLDDVTIYNPTHAFGLFSTFNADVVDDVTLYKGAYPAKYAGRLGAVLDVRNREGPRDGIHGTVGLSTITGRLSIGGPVGSRGSWLAAGRRTYLDPILDRLRESNSQIPAYYFYDANGKLVLPAGGTSRLEWDGYLGQDDLRLDLDADSFVNQRWGNRATSLRYRRLLGESLVGSLMVSGSAYESDTNVRIFTTPIRFGNSLSEVSARADLTWDGFEHRVTAGGQVSRYDFTFDQEFNAQATTTFDSTPWDLSGFLEDVWLVADRADLRTGLRVRWFSEGDRVLWEPRVSGSFPVSERIRIRLATGVYHQYLQLVTTEGFSGGDFYLPIDDTLEPGFSWQSVAGAEIELSREWRLTVEGYGTRLRNLVLLDNNISADESSTASTTVFKSGGTGWTAGLELFAERRLGPVTGWIGYTLGWTRRTFPEVNGGEAFAPKYDRRHDLSAVVAWRNGPWTFSNTLIYGTGQAFTPATARYGVRNPATGSYPEFGQVLPGEKNSGRLLPYHRMDVAVTRDFGLFGRNAQAVLQVFNLYSRRNEWFVQYDNNEPDAAPEVVKQLPIIPSLGVNVEF